MVQQLKGLTKNDLNSKFDDNQIRDITKSNQMAAIRDIMKFNRVTLASTKSVNCERLASVILKPRIDSILVKETKMRTFAFPVFVIPNSQKLQKELPETSKRQIRLSLIFSNTRLRMMVSDFL